MNASVLARPGVAFVATPGTALRVAAVLALVSETAAHVYLAPDHLEEMPYIGVGGADQRTRAPKRATHCCASSGNRPCAVATAAQPATISMNRIGL